MYSMHQKNVSNIVQYNTVCFRLQQIGMVPAHTIKKKPCLAFHFTLFRFVSFQLGQVGKRPYWCLEDDNRFGVAIYTADSLSPLPTFLAHMLARRNPSFSLQIFDLLAVALSWHGISGNGMKWYGINWMKCNETKRIELKTKWHDCWKNGNKWHSFNCIFGNIFWHILYIHTCGCTCTHVQQYAIS